MAHLIQDGFMVNDHTWKLGIFITDLNISKEIYVRGDMTIGTLMMQLVNEIGNHQYVLINYCLNNGEYIEKTKIKKSPMSNTVFIKLGEAQDWSDHALWWPDRCKWLKHTRSTLDQVSD